MSHNPNSLPIPTAIDVDEARGVTLRPNRRPQKPLWVSVLEPLASLKLTVVLLAFSIVLVFFGTLAQWRVETHDATKRYFRVWVARVELGDLTPKNFFPDSYRVTEAWETAKRFNEQGNLTNWLSRDVTEKPESKTIEKHDIPWFPLPGGIPLGILMTLNLLAAHGLKFKIQARGARAWGGLATILAGAGMVWWVVYKQGGEITAGISRDAQGYLWNGIAIALAGLWALAGYGLMTYGPEKKQQRIYTAVGGLIALAAFVFVMYRISNDAPLLDPNNTRILWQLIQAEFAAITLLVGCYLVFMKRAGVVLLHGGILLLMFNELLVYKTHVEWQMDIVEKRSNWHAKDVRNLELAIERDIMAEPATTKTSIEPNGPKLTLQREVISIPWERLWDEDARLSRGRVSDPLLPMDFEVVQFYKNSSIQDAVPGEKRLDTEGLGQKFSVTEERPVSSSDEVNRSAAWVKVYAKGAKEPLGTYLFNAVLGTIDEVDSITVPVGKEMETFNVSLRFERAYKPYVVDLEEVRKDDYLGSDVVRNYSSDIKVHDLADGSSFERHIRMNDPLRYKGETFYQSGFDNKHGQRIIKDERTNEWRLYDPTTDSARFKDTRVAVTTLQIVANKGWMLPYMCCMIVLTGMVYHFLSVATRYFSRYGRESVDPLFVGLVPGVWVLRMLAPKLFKASDEYNKTVSEGAVETKSKKKRLKDATQFEVTTSQFDVHAEDRSPWPLVMTLVFVLSFLGYTIYRTLPAKTSDSKPDYRGFGEIPAVFKGRVKPLDTLARNSLSLISRGETFVDINGQRQPAIKWLLDLWADFENFKYHKIIYIENPELLKAIGLPRRKAHLYSYEELSNRTVQAKLNQLISTARSKDSLKLDILDKRAMELSVRWRVVEELLIGNVGPAIDDLAFNMETPPDRRQEEVKRVAMAHAEEFRKLEFLTVQTPLLIPVPPEYAIDKEDKKDIEELYDLGMRTLKERAPNIPREMLEQKLDKLWSHPVQPVGVVTVMNLYPQLNNPQAKLNINPFLRSYKLLLHDYYQRDYAKFNEKVPEYRDSVMKAFESIRDSADTKYGSGSKYSADNVPFESWFNAWNPFAIAMPFYFIAAICAVLGLILAPRSLLPATYWLLWAIFLVHTVGLGARVYLSGRPPVTNLYSSAVFIGWGMVLLALLLEGYSRRGFGSIAAGAAGFATLLISGGLFAQTKDWSSTGGDTMGVMQAVLDTDFWLATHVVTVALGYATTALAGIFGGIYLLINFVSYMSKQISGRPLERFNTQAEKEIHRFIYGTICFAIIFSFVGTVLGGLWADDSWGRFWGWDPKENGALIIVLWNALVLHARWDGMVKERGVAVLSLTGAIVTGWSWFGVNELGVGLHSYGFTDGTMLKLGITDLTAIALMFLGFVPRSASPVAEVTVDEAKMA